MKFWNSGVVWNVASCDAAHPPTLEQVRPKFNRKITRPAIPGKSVNPVKPVKPAIPKKTIRSVKPDSISVTPLLNLLKPMKPVKPARSTKPIKK